MPSVIRSAAASRFAHRFLACRAGNISVELALLSPILLLVFLGVVEYGRAYTEQLNLSRMARVQLQYAVENLGASTVLDEIDGHSTTLPNGDTITYAATTACTCLGAATGCQTLCDGTSLPQMEIQVSATRALTPLVFFPGNSGPLTLAATTAMRAR
jgi:Flp pilus assembly protein TadG